MFVCRKFLLTTNKLISLKPLNFNVTDSRNIKRWVSPTLKEIARRRKRIGPDPLQPRSTYLEWNYDTELFCFMNRLHEKFDENLLRKAFVQREYANIQEFKAKEENQLPFTPEENNYELAQTGYKIISNTIKNEYSKLYPSDIVNAVHDYLTNDNMLAHIGKHIGINDLVKAVEFPLETKTVADTFKAVVGALSLSADDKKTETFIKDFVICQMNGIDVYDIWEPKDPYGYLEKLINGTIEPRLCNQSAINTVLANYQVGIYDDKKQLLGIGWGETVQTAQDTAAINAIQRIYSKYKIEK